LGGGGPLPFGKTKPVVTVDLHLSPVSKEAEAKKAPVSEAEAEKMPAELLSASEGQILINIHELFHCFQREVYSYRFGNLRMNPDANYAIYSEIEGMALEKAFLAKDEGQARDSLKDFLVAREFKRESMTEVEQNQESEDELMEGTAVYAEARALELIKAGYKPVLSKEVDPFFYGFSHADFLLRDKLNALKAARASTLDARMRCYSYGCFQALLLSRIAPGWQTNFFQEKKLLDQVIRESVGLKEDEKDKIAARLKTDYPFEEIRERNTKPIKERDDALAMIKARQGRVYVVNFKPTQEYLRPETDGKSYMVGLIHICPEGISRVKVQEVLFEGQKSPMILDQLYYIKWVDTEAKAGEKGYTLTYGRKEGEDIFYDAVFATRGFTLRAPKIRVKEIPFRVKVIVLAKIAV
ncbi:MAG: hypothetical protein AB1715_09810, partial [Acidobacteriota bacterium]